MKDDHNFGYYLGQSIAVFVALMVVAITAALAYRVIMWVLGA